jgi:hypothetical protein
MANKAQVILTIISILVGVFSSQLPSNSVLKRMFDKSTNMTKGINADVRFNMYLIGLELVAQNRCKGTE